MDSGEAVSRVLSVPQMRERESFVSAAVPETRPEPPEGGSGTGAGRPRVSYLALLPMGFSVPPRLLLERWALTPPFHPCPAQRTGRFVFCGTVRRKALTLPAHVYPGIPRSQKLRVPSGYVALRPVEFGLSSPGVKPGAILHPSGIQASPYANPGDKQAGARNRRGNLSTAARIHAVV